MINVVYVNTALSAVQIKKLEKDKLIPEDKSFAVQKEIQKETDSFVSQVDEALKHKEAEIHEV